MIREKIEQAAREHGRRAWNFENIDDIISEMEALAIAILRDPDVGYKEALEYVLPHKVKALDEENQDTIALCTDCMSMHYLEYNHYVDSEICSCTCPCHTAEAKLEELRGLK